MNHLTAKHLMPLLRRPSAEAADEGGRGGGGRGGGGGASAARTAAIYLLGRVGLMAPSARAAQAVWLRQQLGLVLQELTLAPTLSRTLTLSRSLTLTLTLTLCPKP